MCVRFGVVLQQALSLTGFLWAADHSVEISGCYTPPPPAPEIYHPNAVYKPKLRGFRLGAMSPSTG